MRPHIRVGRVFGILHAVFKGNPLIELTILLILRSSPSAEKHVHIVLTSSGGQGYESFLMAATGHHLEDVIALLRQRNTSTLCRPWRLVRDRTLQDKAERLIATTCQLFEEMKATYLSLGIAGKVAGKFIRHPVDLQTALVEMWCGTSTRCPQQCFFGLSAMLAHTGILSSTVVHH